MRASFAACSCSALTICGRQPAWAGMHRGPVRRRQGDSGCNWGTELHGAHLGVAVPLVDRGVGAEEVKVTATIDIPHEGPTPALEHHRERRIVVRAVLLLAINELHGL